MHARTTSLAFASLIVALTANVAFAQSIPQPPSVPDAPSSIPEAPAAVPLMLATLTIDGADVPGFVPGVTSYTREVPATSTPVVAALALAPDATVAVTQAAAIPGDATVVVTRGAESLTVTVRFTAAPVVITQPEETRRSGGGGGGGGSSKSKSKVQDVTAPTKLSLVINKNATKTDVRKVTLALKASDTTGPLKMQISQDGQFMNAKWVTYRTSQTFTLSGGAGTQTVYARFMDGKKNVSGFTADSIILTEKGAKTPYAGPSVTAGSVLGTSSYFFTSWLKIGSTGIEVTELQKRLTAEKAYAGPVTGYYGTMTALGVVKYQKANNLPVTGTLDIYTRAHLNSK